jgi:hypothetical protein
MSSLFSYELDEAQIRLTLQNSKAVEYNEASWDDFEANYVQHSTHQNLSKFKLPNFNLNINRNVVLPIIFIAGLVGISAIMLSFIDFKTNEPKQVEKALIPDPGNFKPTEHKSAVLNKIEPEKAVEKPIIKADTAKIIANPTPGTPNEIAVISNPVANNTIASSAPLTHPVAAASDSSSGAKTDQSVINVINQSYPGKHRKRRRKMPTEQIETIKAPSILGVETTTTEKEPELEIKLD